MPLPCATVREEVFHDLHGMAGLPLHHADNGAWGRGRGDMSRSPRPAFVN